MTLRMDSRQSWKGLIAATILVLASACGDSHEAGPAGIAQARPVPPPGAVQPTAMTDTHVDIGNTRYLFVLEDHSAEELEALLRRADEVARTSLDRFDRLDIALVIHGPSVRLFTGDAGNRELVDLAAKLDAFDVLDVKICRQSLQAEGISEDRVPSFIDTVPFAPDEIVRLSAAGYVTL